MRKKGTYYIGRVLKLGVLDQIKLLYALKIPATTHYRGNAWTITDFEEHKNENMHFIFGRLSKYTPEGEVAVVDTTTKSEKRQLEPNLLIASSPFIYIPEHSGIAFLQVSNHIEAHIFRRRFADIIKKTHDNFFVDCDIELISDLKSFAVKVSSLDGIFQISARISPPNPLFNPLWKPLEDYLRKRNTDRMTIVEDANQAETLKTQLPELIKQASELTGEGQLTSRDDIPVGDAAILMAADGYGTGLIRGKKGEDVVTIKTSETAVNFSFDKIPDINELYQKVLELLEKIKKSRHMEHGE